MQQSYIIASCLSYFACFPLVRVISVLMILRPFPALLPYLCCCCASFLNCSDQRLSRDENTMTFPNTQNAARIVKSAAKGAAQATRGFSLASKAKEKKSRRFFPAAVFSVRNKRPAFTGNAPPLDRKDKPRDERTSLQASRQASRWRDAGGVVEKTLVGYGGGSARRRKLPVSLLEHPVERRTRNVVGRRTRVEGKASQVVGSARAPNVKKNGVGGPCVDDGPAAAARAVVGARAVGTRMFDPLLRSYEGAGKWEQALDLLARMRQVGVRPDLLSYNATLSACAKGRKWREAVALLRRMPGGGVPPDRVSYELAVKVCGNCGQGELATTLLREMPKVGITPSVLTYNEAITVCGGSGEWRLALDLLKQMLDDPGVTLNVGSYNAAMTACCHVGEWEKTVALLRGMGETGVNPNMRSFNIAIKACGDGGQWRQGVDLFREMEATAGVTVNMESYSAVVGACGRAGQWEATVALLKEMSTVMNVAAADRIAIFDSFLSPTNGYAAKWRRCRALLTEMTAMTVDSSHGSGGRPKGVACGSEGCVTGSESKEAVSRLQEMSGDRIPESVGSYSMAITKCGHSGQWKEAVALLRQMPAMGVPPNDKCYRSAMAACGSSGQWELALELLQEMPKAGIARSEKSYRAAISACGNCGRWREAVDLLREIATTAGGGVVTPSAGSYSVTIMACGDSREWQQAVSLLREMPAAGVAPTKKCYNAAITACGDGGQWAEAVALLREMPGVGISPCAGSVNAAAKACKDCGQLDQAAALLGERERPSRQKIQTTVGRSPGA